jgi:hypothetical protein
MVFMQNAAACALKGQPATAPVAHPVGRRGYACAGRLLRVAVGPAGCPRGARRRLCGGPEMVQLAQPGRHSIPTGENLGHPPFAHACQRVRELRWATTRLWMERRSLGRLQIQPKLFSAALIPCELSCGTS